MGIKLKNLLKEATSTKIEVFRVGKNPNELANRDAASLEGLVRFINADDMGLFGDQKITMYSVEVFTPFGEYVRYRNSGSSNHKFDPNGPAVGFLKEKGWYSFPENGAYKYKVIKSVTVPELNAAAKKFTENSSSKPTDIFNWVEYPKDKEKILRKIFGK